MRNRAKCKLCNETIESYTIQDYVTCKCGEIAICGGNQRLETYAHDYKNFLRVDDNGHEFPVSFKDANDCLNVDVKESHTRDDLINMLDQIAAGIERMPDHAKYAPATNADIYSIIVLLSALMRSES